MKSAPEILTPPAAIQSQPGPLEIGCDSKDYACNLIRSAIVDILDANGRYQERIDALVTLLHIRDYVWQREGWAVWPEPRVCMACQEER